MAKGGGGVEGRVEARRLDDLLVCVWRWLCLDAQRLT